MDPRNVIYTKTRPRTPSTDQSSIRSPYRKTCTRTANCFISRHPSTGSTFFTCVFFPVSSRTIRRCLAERHLRLWCLLRVLPLTPTQRHLRLEWCHARGNWFAVEWNQVVFSDESRFKLSSHDHRVRVWRPRRQRLNPSFALQPYTAPVAGVMVTRNCNRTIRTSTKEEIVIFLEQVLPELLDDVHASTVMHPCVLCGAIKMEPTPIEAFLFHLNATFDQRWSGHGGSMHRPTQ
ncbi:UNVERIFIED_CONTAM: hypothetical protein NCL1_22578 [Trichonephila clavipes]